MFSLTFLVILVTLNLGPLSTLARPNNEGTDKMPKICQGKNYCFYKHHNYPQEQVDKILNESGTDLWVEDETKDFDFRVGSDNNDCKVDKKSGAIYEIIDKDGNLRYVVQSDNRFKQLLRVEECVKPGRLNVSRTLHFTKDDLFYNVLTCEQKNIHFNFLVLTPDFKGVELAQAMDGIPVCCACEYHGPSKLVDTD